MNNRVVARRALLGGAGLASAVMAAGCLGALPVDPTARGIARSPSALAGLREYSQRPYWLLRGRPGWLGSHEAMFSGDDGTRAGYDFVVRAAHFAGDADARSAAAWVTADYLQRLFRTRFPEPPYPVSELLPYAGREQRVFQYATAAEQPEAGASLFLVTAAGDIALLLESTGLTSLQLASWANLLLTMPA